MSTQESGGVLPGFSDLRNAEARSVRRDAGGNLQPGAFTDPSGIVRPIPGDGFYPHSIEPPDLYGPELYADDVTLPQATAIADFTTLPEIDVRGAKTLRLDFFWTPGTVGAQPSWVVEANAQGSTPQLNTERWVRLGVVDSTLTTAAAAFDGMAFRLTYSAEFRLPALTGTAEVNLTLDYDVFTKDVVRVRMADIVNADTALLMMYTLAR